MNGEGQISRPETLIDRIRTEVWIAIVSLLFGGIVGMFTGQLNPNRSLVTADQLTPVVTALAEQNAKIEVLTNRVSDLTGQLKAQKLISTE
jgi:hypothetical protein